MHELALSAYLLESVEEHAREAGARRVVAINLVVGDRSCVEEEALRFCFELLSPGTLAERAQLALRWVPMRFWCNTCAAEYTPDLAGFHCPRCGTVGGVLDDGTDVLIESLEIET
jgi:hydrogenase nickel incorporation protein HypA/HybF